MTRSFGKWFDLYVNKFGYDISYNHLMKMVPLNLTEKSDVFAQNLSVILAISFYFGNHAGLYTETWGNISENNLEVLFAC